MTPTDVEALWRSTSLTSRSWADSLVSHMRHTGEKFLNRQQGTILRRVTLGLVVATYMIPSPSWAQIVPPIGIESQQEDDDLDSNLVPLEPELSATPPDLPSAEGTLGQARDPATQVPAHTSLQSSSGSENSPAAVVYNIPIVIDPTVQSHIRFFNTSIHDRFEQWLLRFNRYRPLVENIFAEFNLPSDLVNLSLVESGFNPYAYSRAKATGPWQFMKGTGLLYGLRIDHYVDERRDPIKSTVAAARYLRDLYDLFGAWPLAMAAYNAGEGKVLRALHKAQAESFSDISRTRLIRPETKQYVPRIMAATIIAKNPNQYGFSQGPVTLHDFEEVAVTRPLHFRAISNSTGIPYSELRLLNPELRRDATPPDSAAYRLKVPVGTSDNVLKAIDRIPTYKFPPIPAQSVHADSARRYRVRVGDTLEKLSRRFRVPLETIKTRNNLSSRVIKAGDLLVITH